jgi:hypothetical protein
MKIITHAWRTFQEAVLQSKITAYVCIIAGFLSGVAGGAAIAKHDFANLHFLLTGMAMTCIGVIALQIRMMNESEKKLDDLLKGVGQFGEKSEN